MTHENASSQIVLFESSDGEISLDVTIDLAKNEIWLNRAQMAALFDRDVKTIGKHISNALREELCDTWNRGRKNRRAPGRALQP